MIGVINYGMGNLASVQNALDFLEIKNTIISLPTQLKKCSKVILPGVGAYGNAMKNINEMALNEEINEFVLVKKKPILGICLGMQLLLKRSFEFGMNEGLGILDGEVLPFHYAVNLVPVPHIGWNDVSISKDSILLRNIEDAAFYFVHSFYCYVKETQAKVSKTEYEIEFDSVVEYENIFGTQFHPEKSQKSGLQIFRNFHNL